MEINGYPQAWWGFHSGRMPCLKFFLINSKMGSSRTAESTPVVGIKLR